MRVLGFPSGVDVATDTASRSGISPLASSNHLRNCANGFGSQSSSSSGIQSSLTRRPPTASWEWPRERTNSDRRGAVDTFRRPRSSRRCRCTSPWLADVPQGRVGRDASGEGESLHGVVLEGATEFAKQLLGDGGLEGGRDVSDREIALL